MAGDPGPGLEVGPVGHGRAHGPEPGPEAGGRGLDHVGLGRRARPQAVVDVDRGHLTTGGHGEDEQGQ